MNRHQSIVEIILSATLLLTTSVWAAPSLPITKAPVTPNPSFTGPTGDPHAISGEWFMDVETSNLSFRTHQFHDNIPAAGGGYAGSLSIQGKVVAVEGSTFPPPTTVSSFTIEAVVVNDAPSIPGSWTNGSNSHNEQSGAAEQYTNTLINVVLTADFSVFASNGVLQSMSWSEAGAPTPYRKSFPFISAVNHDCMGWYCWTPGSAQTPSGDFLVPGWTMGNIPPGQSATQLLQFVVLDEFGSPSVVADTRATVIWDSFINGTDIFIGRSLSLKIANWIADPAADDGSAYPLDASLQTDAGNVSVFHNIIATVDPNIDITQVQWVPGSLSVALNSVGSSGITWQILQSSTNLMNTNWTDVVTNLVWPSPQTNYWTNSSVSGNARFYRIVQP